MMEIDALVYRNNLVSAMLNSANQSSCGGHTYSMISGDISCNFFNITSVLLFKCHLCRKGGHTIISSAL
jgi:hypothetical protein